VPFDNERPGKLALVVDDSEMQCKVLGVMLKQEGYDVITANNGVIGVEMYGLHQPDLVLMDINMPEMNGYEATRRIKSISKGTLAPLIFITSLDSEQAFIEGIEAGGDGVLVRPFSPQVFKAKIKSIERISNLYSKVKLLQQTQQKDAELAEQLMAGVIESKNYALDRIKIVKKPAELFSGDIQLSARCPNGDVNVLLGDFTGHGLRSSIGAIPLSETFRAMTQKGFSLLHIVSQINSQLHRLLPPDLFLCATFVKVSSADETAYVINAGLPDCYHFSGNGNIKTRFVSSHPPLGVLGDLVPGTELEAIPTKPTDRIVLVSDGILEARNSQGDMYGEERFEQMCALGIVQKQLSDTVISDVTQFCQNMPQEDDISLIELPCDGWLMEHVTVKANQELANDIVLIDALEEEQPAWTWSLNLSGTRLAMINPIPHVMVQVQEIEGYDDHWQSLHTILTELYVNALDHGILNLDSELKSSAEGFAEYFKLREHALKELTSGDIHIELSYYPHENSGHMHIKIKDSGSGFDVNKQMQKLNNSTESVLYGRGVFLVNQLCESLVYSNNGSCVEAKFVWC